MSEEQKPNLDKTTVNGLPVSSLSEVGQAMFLRLMDHQKRANEIAKQVEELSKEHEGKQAVIKELADMISEEVVKLQVTPEESSKSESEA